MNFISLNHFNSQIIDGCIFLSSTAQELLKDKKIHLNLEGKFYQQKKTSLNHGEKVTIFLENNFLQKNDPKYEII